MKLSDVITEVQKGLPEMIGKIVADQLAALKTPQVHDFGKKNRAGIVSGSDLFQTKQGSIVNLKAAKTGQPYWIELSSELEEWANEFKGKFINPFQQTKVLEVQTDSSGGFIVPEEVRNSIVQVDAPGNIVWPRSTRIPMSTDKLSMPKLAQVTDVGNEDYFAGVAFTWTDEGGTKTSTQPVFEQISLLLHELSGYTEVTDKLIQMSPINFINWVTTLFRNAYMWQTDQSFLRSNGVGRPMGVIADPSVTVVNRVNSLTVKWQDMINMDAELNSVFDSGAIWLLSKPVWLTLRNERDTNGALLFKEYANIAEGFPRTILGKEVVLSDGKTYAKGAKGDVVLGNFTHYYVGEGQRMTIDSSMHYKFQNNITSLRITGDVDGKTAQPEAFVVLDLTAGGS